MDMSDDLRKSKSSVLGDSTYIELKQKSDYEQTAKDGLELREMSKQRHWKNQFLLSFAFLCNYTAYGATQNIQSTINTEGALGLMSLMGIYGFMIITGVMSPLVIKVLGAKWTMVFCALSYVLYSYANIFSSFYPIMIASCILGICGSPVWVAQATYVNRSAYELARILKQPEELIVNRLNGVFYIIFYCFNITGNLTTYFVLSLFDNDGGTENLVLDTEFCGASNCGVGVGSSQPPPSPATTQLLFVIFTSMNMTTVLLLLFGVDDQQVVKRHMSDRINVWGHSRAVFQLMTDTRMTLLLPLLIFNGLQEAFTFGDFTKAYVACSQGVAFIGLVLTSYGISSSLFGLIFGQLEKVTDRTFRIAFGFVCQLGLLVWLYYWQPAPGQIWPLLASAFVWGMCTVVWRSQMACLLGVMFPSQQEAAFSLMVLSQAIGWVIGLLLATMSSLCVGHRLIILAVVLIGSFSLYLCCEYRHRTRTRTPSGWIACRTKEINL